MVKIGKSSFLYLEPKSQTKNHAQCETCMMWTGPKSNTCTIHGKDVKVTKTMSCGFYIEGKPVPDAAGQEHKFVTPEESGLVDRKVRCENCEHANKEDKTCMLFEALNEELSDYFDLDTKIDPKGCCNAQTEITPSIDKMRDQANAM